MTVDALAPTNASVHTLIVVSWAGRVWYLSPDDVGDIDSDDGLLPFEPLAEEVDLAQGAELGEMASPDEAEIAVILTGLQELLAAGHRLSTATAEISRWVMGTPFEDRCVWVSGGLVDPVYGAEEEPVEATVSSASTAPVVTIPAADAKVDGTTWNVANIPEGSIGVAYPIPIGYPGIDAVEASGWHSGSQAVTASGELYHEMLVIADRPVVAATVWINSEGDINGEEVPVTIRPDALGRMVSVIDYNAGELYSSGASDVGDDLIPATDNDVAIYVGWPAGSGGILGPDGTVLRRAGDVLRWALEASGVPVEAGSLAAAGHLLRDYLIDGVIDDFSDPVDWVKAALVPILPISVVETGGRLEVVYWKLDATEADAIAHLDADEPDGAITRESGVTEHTADVANDIRVEYGYSVRTGAYLRAARVGLYVEEHASTILEGPGGDLILLEAKILGERGAGTTVSCIADVVENVNDPGGGSLEIYFFNSGSGSTTSEQVVDLVNTLSTRFRAKMIVGPGTAVWEEGPENQERDYVTALRRTQGQAGDPLCTLSRQHWPKIEKVFQTAFVCDAATAHRIAHDKAAEFALPWSDVDYSVPENRYLHLRRGHVVVVSDAEIGWTRRVCLVKEIQPMGDGFLGVRLWKRGDR